MEKYLSKICLDGKWNLYIEENKNCRDFASLISSEEELKNRGINKIEGTVPGNFEIDMMREGLIPDLFSDLNPLIAQELENRHLWYATEFQFDGDTNEKFEFLFEGVDTFADYYLNGEYLGSTDNMLVEHELEAKGLVEGKNHLLVHIYPTEIKAREKHFEAGIISVQHCTNSAVAVRKCPSMYGWDIMPRMISGGIWKSVYLVSKKKERIEEIYMYLRNHSRGTSFENHAMYFRTTIDGDFAKEYSLHIKGVCGDSVFEKEHEMWHSEGMVIPVRIANPKLWWPRNMGEQNLYEVTVTLKHGEEILDTKTFKYGVRKVWLNRSDYIDKDGNGQFEFLINEKLFFAMGTNWVPLDALHSRDKERLPKALELLYESGSNIVRCWGGNVYENDEFFDFCDQKGIVVWQDFAMGCSVYPQNEGFLEEMRKEVRKVVKRLRQHPSIIMWAGDNEVDAAIMQHFHDPNKNKITRKVIPDVLEEIDPCRLYLPSSPYCSQKCFNDNMKHRLPEDHLWGPRRYYKEDFFKNSIACFASETGYHGSVSPESVKRFLTGENIWPFKDMVKTLSSAPNMHQVDYNKAWQLHASCTNIKVGADFSYRIPLMAVQINNIFGDSVPDNLEDFCLASQISQSEAFKYFIEIFRANKPYRTGIIWWNLLDGWPQFSDAVVDYYHTKKMAYFTICRVQKPVSLMFRDPSKVAGRLELIGANETAIDTAVSYKVTDIETGDVILSGDGQIPAFSNCKLYEIPKIKKQGLLLIEFTVNGKTYKNHYLTGEPNYDYKKVVEWFKKAELLEIDGF